MIYLRKRVCFWVSLKYIKILSKMKVEEVLEVLEIVLFLGFLNVVKKMVFF